MQKREEPNPAGFSKEEQEKQYEIKVSLPEYTKPKPSICVY